MRPDTSGLLQFFALISTLIISVDAISHNISCYQCVKYKNEECGPEALLPCPATSDRCVIHFVKDKQQGFVLKRECGLGPCKFDDEMMNRGLGWTVCDRSRDEYFCVVCCSESGCNKSAATAIELSGTVFLTLFLYLYIDI